jgi:hypothetical protein
MLNQILSLEPQRDLCPDPSAVLRFSASRQTRSARPLFARLRVGAERRYLREVSATVSGYASAGYDIATLRRGPGLGNGVPR